MVEINSFEGTSEKSEGKILIDVKPSSRWFTIRHIDDVELSKLTEREIVVNGDYITLYYNPYKFVNEITNGREVSLRIYPEKTLTPTLHVGCQEFPLNKLMRYYNEVCEIIKEEISQVNTEVTYIKKNNTPDSNFVKNVVYAENDEAYIVKYSDGRLKSFLKSEYSKFKTNPISNNKYISGKTRVLLRKDGSIHLDFGGYNQTTYCPGNRLYQGVMDSYINGVKYFMDLINAVENVKKEIYETL
jgi:hypothetical protein